MNSTLINAAKTNDIQNRIDRETVEIETLVRDVEGRDPNGQPAKDRWRIIEEKAAFIKALQRKL
jgi:hypothetical protein